MDSPGLFWAAAAWHVMPWWVWALWLLAVAVVAGAAWWLSGRALEPARRHPFFDECDHGTQFLDECDHCPGGWQPAGER